MTAPAAGDGARVGTDRAATGGDARPTGDGVLVVDKPAGWTSHDVVARVRRVVATRRVGHAGTLDPMATGVLVLGIGRGTRLLGHLSGADKAYDATIRLGASTVTDDAEGAVLATADAAGVGEDAVRAAMAGLTGEVAQVPSRVSAIKVEGRRSYDRVRAGEDVDLPARPVTVHAFDLVAVRRPGPYVDLDVAVTCSSGTYVRALARDLGDALGVGGHLTALRRTRVGPFGLDRAVPLDHVSPVRHLVSLAAAAQLAFPALYVDVEAARRLGHGVALPPTGLGNGPVAVLAPDGGLVALVQDVGPRAKPLVVFAL